MSDALSIEIGQRRLLLAAMDNLTATIDEKILRVTSNKTKVDMAKFNEINSEYQGIKNKTARVSDFQAYVSMKSRLADLNNQLNELLVTGTALGSGAGGIGTGSQNPVACPAVFVLALAIAAGFAIRNRGNA